MSNQDNITSKEFDNMKAELSKSIKEVHDTTLSVLVQATKTNGRVNTIEDTLEGVSKIIERHDRLLVMDEGRSSTKDMMWKVAMWLTLPAISLFSYFGWLYIEHIKTEVIAQTSSEVITLIESKYNPKIK